MGDDTHLDGNALAGVLYELFGREMTSEAARCGNCGAINPLGAVLVYRQAPGDVIRCPNCGIVLVVIVQSAHGLRISFEAIRWLESRSEDDGSR
jgi:uncharacterized Zn finger protein